MKTFSLLLSALFIVIFYSCEPVSYVRLVKDHVKKTETYLLNFEKITMSKISQVNQKFKLEFYKVNKDGNMIDIFISTNRFPTVPPFTNEAYLLAGAQKINVDLINTLQIPISEKNVVQHTNTTYQTTFNHVPVTTTVQKTVDDVPVTETKTEIQLVQSQVPVQNNYNTVTESNYIAEKFKISIAKETLENICISPQFTLRIYNAENDFWNIVLTNYNVIDIKNFLNNKVAQHNISIN
ncbi:MAG: hypothetical protein IPN86_07790 [Saprospiraceae bacterium]|nr:hypothetical protein [Saprospiraceae bacterium]